jgi:hypothetical protein
MHRVALSRRRSSSAWLAASVCILSLAGCPVDDRQLESVAADRGGAGSSGQLPATTGGSDGWAGAESDASAAGGNPDLEEGGVAGADADAGAGAAPPVLVDGCADLDSDGVSDCSETLAVNATFDSDVAAWSVDAQNGDSFSTILSWAPENAWGSEPSGSAQITVSGAVDFNGATLRAATQCIEVGPVQLVVVGANAKLDVGQDPAGSAEVDVSFFDNANCIGSATTTFATSQPQPAPTGSWLTLHAGSLSTAATQSALIKLGVVKPFRTQALSARFDNILVRVQPP